MIREKGPAQLRGGGGGGGGQILKNFKKTNMWVLLSGVNPKSLASATQDST